jgi:hypothetical protein
MNPSGSRAEQPQPVRPLPDESMKTTALTVTATTVAAFIMLLLKTTTVTVYHEAGLLNPILRFQVPPERETYLTMGLLTVAYSMYTYWIIACFNENLAALRQAMPKPEETAGETQPLKVRALKDAIRSGDPQAVRELANDGFALNFADARYLTPLELAELYGNENVIAIIRDALARKG